MRLANRRNRILHFLHDALAKLPGRKLDARLDHRRILFRGQPRLRFQVAQDPALALSHRCIAELFNRNLVAPLAERALGKLLDVALVHQRHRLQAVVDRILNRRAHQPLRSRNRDRFDANPRVQPNLLLAALQHVVVQERQHLRRLRRSLAELDARINVLRILTEDHNVHPLRMLHRARHALVVLHRTDALVQIHQLPQRHVQRTNPSTHRCRQRSLDRHAKVHRRLHRIVGQPVLRLAIRLLAGQHLVPLHRPLAAVGLLHRRIENPLRSLPDIAPRSVAFDERNNRMVGHHKLAVFVLNRLAVARDGNAVVAGLHVVSSLRY